MVDAIKLRESAQYSPLDAIKLSDFNNSLLLVRGKPLLNAIKLGYVNNSLLQILLILGVR